MQIDITNENAFARKVNITVPASMVNDELDRAYRSFGRRVNLRGFRKGKVPRRVIEAQFGENIRQDVAQGLIQRGYSTALTEHELDPVSRPSVISQGQLAKATDFSFIIALDVRPTVEAQNYTGLDVYWPKWEIEDEDVDRAVESRRNAQARLGAVEDRAVELGDVVQVEVEAKEGKDVVLNEPGTLVRTENESWLKGLETHLVGMSIDDSKKAEVTFAADARNEDVAGRTLKAKLKVLAIQAMVVPELDEELAKEMGFDSVDALREETRGSLSKGREEQARNQARANLLQALIDSNPFEVPSGMVAQNLELLQEELRLQYAYAGRDPKTIQFSAAQLQDLRIRAAFAAKGALLLEHVSTSEKIEVSEADIDSKLEELAAQRGQTVEALRAYFGGDEAIDELRHRILEEKTLDWLLDQSNVTHEPPATPEAAAEAAPEEAPAVEAKVEKKAPAKKKKAAAKADAPAEEAAPAKKKKAAKKKAPAKEAAPAATGDKSGTVEIKGKTYSAGLINAVGDEGSTIDQAEAEALMAVIRDDGDYGDLEKATMKYLRTKFEWVETADKWFRAEVRKWAAARRKANS